MLYYQLSLNNLIQVHFVDDTVWEVPVSHRRRKPGEYIIYVIRRGEMYIEEDKEKYCLKEGDVLILDPEMIHVGYKASTCAYWYIHFKTDDMKLFSSDMDSFLLQIAKKRIDSAKSEIFSYEETKDRALMIPKYCHLDPPETANLFDILEKARQNNYKPLENYKIMCALHVEEAMIYISRCFLSAAGEKVQETSNAAKRVYQVIEWISEHYGEDISGKLLSEVFDCNYDYLNRSFKKVTGKTILQHITEVRISHAKILLLHTSMKVSDIGKKVGFADEYYFNRVFKKSVGVPPGSFTFEFEN